MGTEDYLMICATKGEAYYLFQRLANYLGSYRPESTHANKRGLVISMVEPNVKVRFVSQREVYETTRGYRGTIKLNSEVHNFLDPLEKEQIERDLRTKIAEML